METAKRFLNRACVKSLLACSRSTVTTWLNRTASAGRSPDWQNGPDGVKTIDFGDRMRLQIAWTKCSTPLQSQEHVQQRGHNFLQLRWYCTRRATSGYPPDIAAVKAPVPRSAVPQDSAQIHASNSNNDSQPRGCRARTYPRSLPHCANILSNVPGRWMQDQEHFACGLWSVLISCRR